MTGGSPGEPVGADPAPRRRRRRVVVEEPRRRRHSRRFWVLIGLAAAVAGLAAVGVDVVVRYLPAMRALQDGQRAADQADAILRGGVQELSGARIAQLDALLVTAERDFGDSSRVITSSWLLDAGQRLPFLGDQVAALRGLRMTGEAGAAAGHDVVPLLRQVGPGAGSGSVLARLTAFAQTDPGIVARLDADIDAVDAAVAMIPPTAHLLGPLGPGRTLAESLVPRLAAIRPAVDLLGLLPVVAGPGDHHYLLLLQNPGEERPSGGFIGAVGEVTLNSGRVTAETFRSSDFADTVRSIPAPPGLDQQLFHGAPLQLGDTGWSPDFPTAAALTSRFYTLATGHTIDGVIGLDPVALGYVLAVTGPVGAAGYAPVVSSQDTLLTLNEIINAARPGDPGKAYLAPFGQALVNRMVGAPTAQLPGIAAALLRAAQEKHVVMSFSNPDLMARAAGAGMTGRTPNPIGDALQVVDANVGGNKEDLVVTRSYSLTASVGALGQTDDTVVLRYTNPVVTDPAVRNLDAQFGDEYRDYLRVYVPEQSLLESMTIADGGAAHAVSPASIDYELQREDFAYLLVVPPGHTVTVTLRYTGAFVDTTVSPEHYTLDWSKEIGSAAWPITVTVEANGHRQQVQGDLDRDRTVDLTLG